jgi:hypothetical protein
VSDRDEFVQKLARAISGAGLGETRFDAELYALEYDGGKLLMEKKDVTPERVFVNAFPTEEMIQAITQR